MDINKLLKHEINVMKWAMKKKSGNIKEQNKYLYTKYENGDVEIIIEGVRTVLIPKCLWLCDTEQVFENMMPISPEQVKNWRQEGGTMLTETGMTRKTEKGTILEYKTADDVSVWLNEKYIKELDFVDTLVLKGTERNAPAAVYDGDIYCGLILPVNVR